MAFGSVDIDPGNTPSEPVAADVISTVNYQRIKLADGTEGSTTATGINANPLKVQQRTRGTSDYDSGNSAVPAVDTEVTPTTTYVDKILLTNISDLARTVTLTNTAGNAILSQYALAPRSSVVLDLGGMECVGLRWSASAGSAVRGQIRGWQ